MLFLWFLLFVSWPIAEIAVFVKMGHAIGWAGAILLTIVTAVLGGYLMQIQGIAAMNRLLESADKGEPPVGPVLDGIGIFTAGVLLLLPGFLTDVAGLLLFIPPLRRRLISWVLTRPGRQAGRQTAGRPGSDGFKPRPGQGQRGFRRSENVVDAEFETVEPAKKPESDSDGASKAGSPWRRT
jgi:UPF0716 protein FxsA